MEYTNKQIGDYVCEWLMADGNQDVAAVKAALRNALAMVEDREGGIETYVECRQGDNSGIPREAREYINECLEEGAKIFMFEPHSDEMALFIEHSHGYITICSWVCGCNEVNFLNIDKNTRDSLAKDLEVK